MEISDAQQYIKSECPMLLSGSVSSQVQSLAGWAIRHQGKTNRDLYKRIAMALSLEAMFGRDRQFVVAVSLKPIRYDQTVETLKVFMHALDCCGPQSERAEKQLTSRNVRAARYLLSQGISPIEVTSLASLKGQGVHSWAAKLSELHDSSKVILGSDGSVIPSFSKGRQKVRITLQVGRGKMRSYDMSLVKEDVGLIRQILNTVAERSPKRINDENRRRMLTPRSRRRSLKGAFDGEFGEFLKELEKGMADKR